MRGNIKGVITALLSYAGARAKTSLVVSRSGIVGLFLGDRNTHVTKLFGNYFCISLLSC
jgi:hypothetical protein